MSKNAAFSRVSATTGTVELVQLPASQVAKRITDVVVSLIVLVALALPAAVITAILKTNGPVLDSQLVTGRQGRFTKYSFHTGSTFGTFLAVSGLAIIPAFINVLRGDINLVELAPTHDTTTSDLHTITHTLITTFTK